MSEDSNDENETEEQNYQQEVTAGLLTVKAQGSTREESMEAFNELWDKVLDDLDELDSQERKQIGLCE